MKEWKIDIQVGEPLYHWIPRACLNNALKEGLAPSLKSGDGSNYGEPRIYFVEKQLEDYEIQRWWDSYVFDDRIEVEVEYDGSFPLYPDPEWDDDWNFKVYGVYTPFMYGVFPSLNVRVPIKRISRDVDLQRLMPGWAVLEKLKA